MSQTLYKLGPSQVRDMIIRCLEVQLVPFVTGSPGIAKSAVFRQIADDFSLEMIDVRLSQCAPEDLMGLPMRDGNHASFLPFKMFPTEDAELPENKNGWLLLLDEFNSATKMVQAAAYKIALDRMVGQASLHPQCFVAAAGNLSTDRAIVNQLSTAMQSRLIHFEMEASMAAFRKHANNAGFDHRILGFLEFQPDRLHSFNPDHTDRTFPCPRTWEFVSKLIKDRPFEEIPQALLAGAIGDGAAVEFHTFLQEFENLPSFQAILDEPKQIPVPPKASTRYAVVSMLLAKVNKDSLPSVATYVNRMSSEFQVLFYRSLVQRYPALRREPAYISGVEEVSKYLHNDEDEPLPNSQAA